VARDLGIHDGTSGNWVNAYRRAHPKPGRPTLVESARVQELEDEIRRLRMENEVLKSRGLLRPDAPVALRCAAIEAEKATYPIALRRVTARPATSATPRAAHSSSPHSYTTETRNFGEITSLNCAVGTVPGIHHVGEREAGCAMLRP
jgi:hypothetical protein